MSTNNAKDLKPTEKCTSYVIFVGGEGVNGEKPGGNGGEGNRGGGAGAINADGSKHAESCILVQFTESCPEYTQ